MGVPYEIDPVAGVSVPGGTTRTEVVQFPARSFVSKIVVVQTSGPEDGFTVELFNHSNAAEGTEASESASAADGSKIPLDCYAICNPLVVPPGARSLKYFSDEATGGHGLLFVCKDPPRADRQGQSMRNLYLRITANGTGAKEFAYSIGGESQIGG